jgi:hypothetical protein
MATVKRAVRRPRTPATIGSDWVRVMKREGGREFPITGAKPEDKARIHMRMLKRRNKTAEYFLCPVVSEVLG